MKLRALAALFFLNITGLINIQVIAQDSILDEKITMLMNRGNYSRLQIENTTIIYDETQWFNNTLNKNINDINNKSDHKELSSTPFELLTGKGPYSNFNIRFFSPHIPVVNNLFIYSGDHKIETAYGKVIFLGSQGIIYTVNNIGGSKQYYLRKFQLEQNTVTEVAQPFYYVGQNSKLNAHISIYNNENVQEQVGLISKDTNVFVIGVKNLQTDINSEYIFLIKGETGIIGWHKPFPVLQGDSSDYLPLYSLDFLTRYYKF